jgi:hypothetical protein
MSIAIGYIWSENNNEIRIPNNFDCEPEKVFSELNDLISFSDKVGLEDLLSLPFPKSWGTPYSDEILLTSFASSGETHFKSFLDDKWEKLIKRVGEEDPIVILTPNGVHPLDWLEASDEEKIEFAEPGVEINFDQYHFGMLAFETTEDDPKKLLEEFESEVMPLLEKYWNSPSPYGFGNLNHVCGSECSYDPCIRAVALPAFLSIEI